MTITSSVQLVLQILGLTTPFILAYIAFLTNKKVTLQKQLDDKKRLVFELFIDVLLDNLNIAGTSTTTSSETMKRMVDVKRNVLVFANPRTIKTFNKWTRSNPNGPESMLHVEQLLKSFRNEIGLSNRGLKKYELLQLFIKDDLSKPETIKRLKAKKLP